MRGMGPWFAFATPVLFALSFIAFVILTSSVTFNGAGPDRTPDFPSWFPVGVGIWVVLLGAMMVSALIVAIDLEWIEHPLTHTGLTYAALASMIVATLAFIAILIEGVANATAGFFVGISFFLFFGGFGVYLILINWVAQRAHLLGRVVPPLGIVTGVSFLLPAFGIFFSVGGVFFLLLIPGVPLFLVWSVWLGLKLRGQAPAPAAAAPAMS